MRFHILLGSLVVLAAGTAIASANATIFNGTFSVIDKSAASDLGFVSDPVPFSWDLTLNEPLRIPDFAEIATFPIYKYHVPGVYDYSDTIIGRFVFTDPTPKRATFNGELTGEVTIVAKIKKGAEV